MKVIKLLASIGVFVACSGFLGLGGGGADNRPIGPDGERLNRIPGTESIDIPQGVSDKQALDVIEATIKGTKAGDTKNYWLSQWRMEARDAGNKWIRIGLTARQHYLSVCYRIEAGKLIPDVPTSTNLKQDGIKIHRKVPVWINNLKPLITMRFYDITNGTAAKDDATKATDTPKAEAAGAFCKFCGKKVDVAANFCGSCGKKLK